MNIELLIASDHRRLAAETADAMPSLAHTRQLLHARGQPRARARTALATVFAFAVLVFCTGVGWSKVYAVARDAVFRVVVELAGKTDHQAAGEIRQQLGDQGWTPNEVSVERTKQETRIELSADDTAGHHIELRHRAPGMANGPVELAPLPLDQLREPGMSDAELRDKILRQLRARGIESAEVLVEGDHVRVLIAPPLGVQLGPVRTLR
ncbi:MAG: hypothetical protein RLZZ450_154 [Pseudomonadota bacterium]|jgi:hypothetical protein